MTIAFSLTSIGATTLALVAGSTTAAVAITDATPGFLRAKWHGEDQRKLFDACPSSCPGTRCRAVDDSGVGGIVIDGSGSDWGALDKADAILMLNAGEADSTKSNYRVWGYLWAKWDCPSSSLYLFSKTNTNKSNTIMTSTKLPN